MACQLTTALLLLLPGAAAEAAGFWNLDRGPSNYARGGANYADPDDPIAVFTNPAALAGLRGLQLSIDANSVFDHRTFQRASDTLGAREYLYDEVRNVFDPFPPSPGIFAAYNFESLGLEALTVGIGVYGPPRSDVVWSQLDGECRLPRPETCSAGQRYSQLESHNLEIHYALAAAYELPWLNLRLGMSLMLIDQILDTSLKLNAPVVEDTNDPENADYDISVYAKAQQSLIPTAIFSASGRPFEWLVLAASVQLPYDVLAGGTANITLSEFYASRAVVEGDAVAVELHLPAVVRAAVQYDDPSGLFDVELAVVWEQWSRNQEIVFYPLGISLSSEAFGFREDIGAVVLDTRWRDTWSFRLGGEVVIIPELLLLRAGSYFEQSAVPYRLTNTGAFDLDKWGITGGGRVDLPLASWLDLPVGVWVDFALGYVWWKSRHVQHSEILLVNPLQLDLIKHPVANGRYTNEQIYVQAGLGVRVDI